MARHPLPSWEWPVMGVAHVVVFAVVIFAQCGSSAATPLFRPEDAIIVEMSGPPSEPSRMPQKAERAPDVQRGTDSMEPMPPNASELALPDAKAQPGDDRADARQALLDEMRREYLLRDLDAPEGRTDRIATSADSKPGDGSAAHAGVRDPELAKWVKAAETSLAKNFHPLPAWCSGNPDILAIGAAVIDASGRITEEASIVESSRTPSYDAACVRAFAVTGQLPAPPAKFAAGLRANLRCECN